MFLLKGIEKPFQTRLVLISDIEGGNNPLCLAYYAFSIDESERSRIFAIVPVVTHYKITVFGNCSRWKAAHRV